MTTTPQYPFAALVALDEMQLALQLAAIDRRLSVLLRGDKGAGKSTAARGLGDLLGDRAPFVNLPIGATEDRILGGLDLARALNGEPALKPGLLAAAHGGVLYIDEVNLLPDHLADAMLDAVASGVHVVEREGFSASQEAAFVLIGSMNPEEGALRPQLLDRFALVVDVMAPMNPVERRAVVERRLAFDRDPSSFAEAWRAQQQRLAQAVRRAQDALDGVRVDAQLLDAISEQVCAHGVRSLRADLAIVRASRALAALDGVEAVTADHVARVLPLALRHRLTHAAPPAAFAPPRPQPTTAPSSRPPGAPPPATPLATASTPGSSQNPSEPATDTSPSTPSADASSGEDQQADNGSQESVDGDAPSGRVFESLVLNAPRILASGRPDVSGAAPAARITPMTASPASAPRGPVIASRRSADPRELDVRSTIVHAIAQTGSPQPRRDDLHEVVRMPTGGRRYLFVIDASGSQAVQQRMRLVKGAVEGLLGSSMRRGDDVGIVTFRGASAEIALAPTSHAQTALDALRYLPTGGRTPLAHALDVAAGLVTDDTVLVLLTDGRANVATQSDDPWADTLASASRVACPALVIDSESGPNATGRAQQLAVQMRATHVPLDRLDQHALLDLLRPAPSSPGSSPDAPSSGSPLRALPSPASSSPASSPLGRAR